MAFLDQDTLSTQVTDIKDGFQISGLCKGGGCGASPSEKEYWRITGLGGKTQTSLDFTPFS